MSISFRLDDKLILVTGASSGIGQSISIEAASAGGRVLLLGRNEERLQQTADRCEGRGIPVPCSLDDLDALPKMVRNLAKEHGPFSGLVHSAGIAPTIPPTRAPIAPEPVAPARLAPPAEAMNSISSPSAPSPAATPKVATWKSVSSVHHSTRAAVTISHGRVGVDPNVPQRLPRNAAPHTDNKNRGVGCVPSSRGRGVVSPVLSHTPNGPFHGSLVAVFTGIP